MYDMSLMRQQGMIQTGAGAMGYTFMTDCDQFSCYTGSRGSKHARALTRAL